MIKKHMLICLQQSYLDLKEYLESLHEFKTYNCDIFKLQTQFVHWLLDCCERCNISNKDELNYINAFRFLNNMLKHNDNLEIITVLKGMFTFPISSNLPNASIFVWADLSKLKINKKFNQEKNRKLYEELLAGESVIQTSEKAINIIIKNFN